MNSSNKDYYSIKEVVALSGKSESTVKRLINKNKGNKHYFKFEKLPTGHQKTYVSELFIKECLNSSTKQSITTDASSCGPGESDSFLNFLIKENERLNKVLAAKNEEITTLHKNHSETIDKFLTLQDQAQKLQAIYGQNLILENSPKSKSWFSKLLKRD